MFAALKLIPFGAKIGILIAFLAALAGLYYIGYREGLNVSAVEIAEYEGKIRGLEADLARAGSKVKIETVTRYLKGEAVAGETVYKTRVVVKESVPEQFTFSNGWIYTYNQSVQGLEVDPALASDPTASGVTDKEALETIVENNGTSLANERQLNALTDYLQRMEKVNEEVNDRRSAAND